VAPPYGLTLTEAAGLIERRELSAAELTASVLERIEAVQPRLHAYVTVMAGEAAAAAAEADRAIAAGRRRGPLHGIPVAVKDIYDVAGAPAESGSRVRAGYVPAQDSEVVRRLREAGAVIVGKTVTHEFAFGVTSPPARCAWDPNCVPGGSSGGSGAAVAADACLAALGTDTGCSIRNPAAINGVVGLKPTYGRVSKRGITPLAWSADHAGPLAKSVRDCAVVLAAIAGHDPDDPTTSARLVDDYAAPLDSGVAGLRIGVPRNHFFDNVRPDVEAAVRAAIAELERLGARLVDVELPLAEHGRAVIRILALVEGAAVHRRDLAERADRYGDEVRLLLETGSLVSGTAYLDAQRVRTLMKRAFRQAFETHRLDAVVTPTNPIGAVPAPGTEPVSVAGEPPDALINHYARFASAFNATGMPALTVPCGFDADGHPAGLQIAGRPFDEATVLRIGQAYESATSWHTMRPSL
jgi:aspartyl-tRNA(Asn)/glutamyl-tRNA(Gln) amidotransferase subunit A